MFKKVLKGFGKIVGVFLLAFIISVAISLTISLIKVAFGGMGVIALLIGLFIIGVIVAVKEEIQKSGVAIQKGKVTQEYLNKEKELKKRIADELFDQKVSAMTNLQVALQTEDKELAEQSIGIIYKIIELFDRLDTEDSYRYADWTERQLNEVLKKYNYL